MLVLGLGMVRVRILPFHRGAVGIGLGLTSGVGVEPWQHVLYFGVHVPIGGNILVKDWNIFAFFRIRNMFQYFTNMFPICSNILVYFWNIFPFIGSTNMLLFCRYMFLFCTYMSPMSRNMSPKCRSVNILLLPRNMFPPDTNILEVFKNIFIFTPVGKS